MQPARPHNQVARQRPLASRRSGAAAAEIGRGDAGGCSAANLTPAQSVCKRAGPLKRGRAGEGLAGVRWPLMAGPSHFHAHLWCCPKHCPCGCGPESSPAYLRCAESLLRAVDCPRPRQLANKAVETRDQGPESRMEPAIFRSDDVASYVASKALIWPFPTGSWCPTYWIAEICRPEPRGERQET